MPTKVVSVFLRRRSRALAATLFATTLADTATTSGVETMQGGELAPRTELVPGTELAPCPKSPNCVSSQATEAGHAIEPLQVTGDPVVAWTTLKGVLESMDRMQIVEESDTVLRAEATSRLFRFVDDLEFILDAETPTIHVRSASRVGYSDMGANRKRVEAIRQKLKDACTGS